MDSNVSHKKCGENKFIIMSKTFFDRRDEKRRHSQRLFNEVYRKMTKAEGKFIFVAFLSKIFTQTC